MIDAEAETSDVLEMQEGEKWKISLIFSEIVKLLNKLHGGIERKLKCGFKHRERSAIHVSPALCTDRHKDIFCMSLASTERLLKCNNSQL